MKIAANRLASAVHLGLSLAVAAAALAPRTAQAQTANTGAEPQTQEFDTIVVTGTNVRRVDTETANPVTTIDRAAIERSGKLTLGDIVQDLPAVTGPYTNPRVNLGGGCGCSNISLRGLGSARTLILVNGHRYLHGDVNAIPASAVERIEVLTDGASAIYGSDAIGGVVNFILRNNYQGAEFSADYGISDRDDGERKGYHFVFGQTTDKGSILAGVDYNKFDSVLAANRDFSKNLVYYYNGMTYILGSRYTPAGRIELPPNLQTQFGCRFVTLKSLGQISNPPRLDDFRCFNEPTDFYNPQGLLELTPQERSSAFVVGNYRLTDDVEAYLEYFHNKTRSAAQRAPDTFDTSGSPLIISAQSYYNPFGVDYASDAFRFHGRTIGNGNRIFNYSTTVDQATAGFKGAFGDTSWQWNAYFNYIHMGQPLHQSGFINLAKLGPGPGPSYKDAAGNIVCGTDPATGGSGPIAGCKPIDLFNIIDPATVAALDATSGNVFNNFVYAERAVVAEANGSLWNLPAGTVQLAAGLSYRKQSGQFIPDATQIPDSAGNCDLGSGCVAPINGGFTIKEAYGELLVPLLKDLPFASALNLIVGDRYSKYSNLGSTNNTKFAIEYRPVEDLLLRGTVSAVFRVPTISDLYAGSSLTDAAVVDPCVGLVGTNAACVGVPGDGSFKPEDQGSGNQILAPTSGALSAGSPIGAEHGKSFDWGFVYDPHWISGLSVSVDLWRVYLINEIGQVNAQSVLDLCFMANGGPWCPLIHRYSGASSQGQINFVVQPIGNLGRVDVKGADFALHYRLGATKFGSFALNFQTTYLDRYTDDRAPGTPGDLAHEFAGHYSSALQANFSRWKALATLNWNLESWSAAWKVRYIGKYTVGYANLDYQESADSGVPGTELKYGATVYHDVTAGYNIEPLKTRIDVGIDNLTDKLPALIYANNASNGNVDANTFDTIGRFYWARVTVKF